MPDCEVYEAVPTCCAEENGYPGGGGLLVFAPLIHHDETVAGGIIYLFLLLWTFVGVAIVSDAFMAAIETITSKQKTTVVKNFETGTERNVQVNVWNDTVANLTLMALGSSAPEILLSVIELITNKMHSGELGPSTVVGSAAFNLFVISAVCISAIPADDYRFIEGTAVYSITASCSVLAYIWMLVMLLVISPDKVDVSEGVITFLMFPLLVGAAFAIDTGKCSGRSHNETLIKLEINGLEMDKEAIFKLRKEMREQYGKDKTDDEIARYTAWEIERRKPKSRAYYKRDAVRNMSGGKSLTKQSEERAESRNTVMPVVLEQSGVAYEGPVIGWAAPHYSVFEEGENDPDVPGKFSGQVTLHIIRDMKGTDKEQLPCTVHYETKDGDGLPHEVMYKVKKDPEGNPQKDKDGMVLHERDAKTGNKIPEKDKEGNVRYVLDDNGNPKQRGIAEAQVGNDPWMGAGEKRGDYIAVSGTIEFAAGEKEKEVKINIQQDDAVEGEEDFYVTLTKVECEGSDLRISGEKDVRVTIIDANQFGRLEFKSDTYEVTEGEADHVTLEVVRINGSSEEVSCKYYTVDGTACGEKDFAGIAKEDAKTLTFKAGQTSHPISITIHDDEAYFEKSEQFSVKLFDGMQNGKPSEEVFTPGTDGGHLECSSIVTIHNNNDDTDKKVNAIASYFLTKQEEHAVGGDNWCQQFRDAFYIEGERDNCKLSVLKSPGVWIPWCLSFPWKFIFAFIPPTDFCGGWLSFCISLGFIGIITAVVGDLATYLGCQIGLKDDVTAITLVALGTSLPDTFASMSAAQQDAHADASLGNIVGSNSVNVFLGLGMPWAIGAFYWSNMDEGDKWAAWRDRSLRDKTFSCDAFEAAVDAGTKLTATLCGDDSYNFEFTYPEGGFMVPAGSLGYSVGWFSGLAVVCLLFLTLRRKVHKGELGGPKGGILGQRMSSLFCFSLWVIYLVVSIIKSYSAE